MKVAARSVEILQPGLEYGVIAGHCEKGFAVTSDRGPINANVAVSCLVEPQRAIPSLCPSTIPAALISCPSSKEMKIAEERHSFPLKEM